jgi:tRNA(fMet)-specific endonuclease VapC
MSSYLLDTNTVIFFFKGIGGIPAKWESTPPGTIMLSAVTLYELMVGAGTSASPKRRRSDLDRIRQIIRVIPFSTVEAEHAARIRASLQSLGRMIGPLDTLIAATALAHDLILVSHDWAEFSRIPDLRCEDWWSATG